MRETALYALSRLGEAGAARDAASRHLNDSSQRVRALAQSLLAGSLKSA